MSEIALRVISARRLGRRHRDDAGTEMMSTASHHDVEPAADAPAVRVRATGRWSLAALAAAGRSVN